MNFRKLFILVILIAIVICGCNNIHDRSGEKVESDAGNDIVRGFPKEKITIVVPYVPGGGTDSVARALAYSATKYFKVPVVVINKTGAGGAIGMSTGLEAEPDGYTVTMITGELSTLYNLQLTNFNYKDFLPILQVNEDSAALTVREGSPYDTIEDFLKAKELNRTIRVGNSGVGSVWHIASAALQEHTNSTFEDVYYDGAAPAVIALLGDEIDGVTVSVGEVLTHVRNEQLKVLGIFSETRIESLPDTPTFIEQGVDFSIGTWRGLGVPRDTPTEIADILEDGFRKAAMDEEFIAMLRKLELGYRLRSSEEFEKAMADDDDLIKDLIENLDIKSKVVEDANLGE